MFSAFFLCLVFSIFFIFSLFHFYRFLYVLCQKYVLCYSFYSQFQILRKHQVIINKKSFQTIIHILNLYMLLVLTIWINVIFRIILFLRNFCIMYLLRNLVQSHNNGIYLITNLWISSSFLIILLQGKKIINRRKTNNDTWSRSRIIELEGEGDNTSNTEHKIAHETNSYTSSFSHCSPAFTPSSLSSSTCSSSSRGTQTSGSSYELYLYQSRSLPMNGVGVTKQKQDVGNDRKGCFVSNRVVCLLFLTSLLVLILWGKFYAILYTSIGFFMVPPCRGRHCNEGDIC